MQWKINLTQVICLWMGKTTEAKPHQMILRSLLPKIHYYQSQAVTSIKNLTKPFGLSRNTNLQLNPYLNNQLDLYCSGNLLDKISLCPFLSNNPTFCPISQTNYGNAPLLKLDFPKIEFKKKNYRSPIEAF